MRGAQTHLARRTEEQRARIAAALRLEAERGALFLLVPVLLGFGAACYFTVPVEPGLSLLGGLGLIFALAVLLRALRPAFLLLAAAGLFAAGMTAGKLETVRLSTKMLGSEVTTRLTGRIQRVDRLAGGRVRLTVDDIATERPKLRYAPDRVRITAARIAGPVQAGMRVEGLVRLMPASGPAMPGGYDFSFHSYFEGVGASGFFLGAPKLGGGGDAPSLPVWIEQARDRIAERIRGQIGGAEGEIAAALAVGVRGGIPERANEALRRTGLAHVLSISGLHMALVAGIAMGGMRAFLSLFPGFASRRSAKKIAAGAALALLCGYLAFSGADVAAVRSFLMLSVMLVAVLFDRAALSVRNLAIAATIILLAWPHEILGPSFQMSFAATGALVATYAAWADRRARRTRPASHGSAPALRVLRGAGSAVGALAATSVVAGLATAAFGIYHFQRVSPLSLPANLAVMPLVSILVMPFGLLGMLAMPFGVDGPFFAVMGAGLRGMLAVAQWFSDRSPLDAVGAISTASLLLVTAALLGFTLATTKLRVLALPVLAAALALARPGNRPDLFVSEEGRLVGVVSDGNSLSVNTAAGGGFTLQNWKNAAAATTVIRPARKAGEAAGRSPKGRSQGEALPRFVCGEETCVLALEDGRTIVHARSPAAASAACNSASVLVTGEGTVSRSCAGRKEPPLVLTARDLALHGSAAVHLASGSDRSPATVRFAIPPTLRPWHEHRRFSRAARGLPEIVRRKRDAKPKTPRGARSEED